MYGALRVVQDGEDVEAADAGKPVALKVEVERRRWVAGMCELSQEAGEGFGGGDELGCGYDLECRWFSRCTGDRSLGRDIAEVPLLSFGNVFITVPLVGGGQVTRY